MSFLKPNSVFKYLTISRFRFSKNAMRRNPVRVLNVPQSEVSSPEPIYPKKQLIPGTLEEKAVAFPAEVRSELIIPPYEKIQKTDNRFTKVLTLLKNRKMREAKGKMLLEGKRLINDAIDAGVELEALYFTREKDLADIKWRKIQNTNNVYKVLYQNLKVWSDLTTCPGVMGVFKRPDVETVRMVNDPVLPVTIVCDNIRDPGNLGSIIRNAAAAGCENVFLMKGCVDPWDTKVLRAGCGGHFRIPIVHDIEWPTIGNYLPQQSTIFIADNRADIEGSSSSSDFIHFDEIEDSEEQKKYLTTNAHGQPIVMDETLAEPNQLEVYEDIHIPAFLYCSIKYPKQNIVLYVGGETHGVDPRIVKLYFQYGGRRIKIPLEHNMESLNSSFAMTIVLYEIKRQLTETYVTK